MTPPQPTKLAVPLAVRDAHSWESLARLLIVHARRLGASLAVAEDVVQDALTVVLKDPSWYDAERAQLLTVLKVVVRNRWIDVCRSERVRTRPRPTLVVVNTEPSPEHRLMASRAAACRAELLSMLSTTERDLFRMWLRQRRAEVSGSEASALLGLSLSNYEAAKKRLRRRCAAVLTLLELNASDLFEPTVGGPA